MTALIIFESLHGSTEKCAKILSGQISADVKMQKLQGCEDVAIEPYDIVIIGGSIHHGVIHTRVANFMEKNHAQLLQKKLGIYLCCMEEGDTAKQQFERAYPADLREKAIAKGLFGGEFNLRKMNFFEKKLTRKLTGIKSSVSKLNEMEIQNFANNINKVIIPS
jgi:menaquinone-dependent protoporphyrinogen oxidase